MKIMPETMTADGAQYIKDRIRAYWRGKGYKEPVMFVQRAPSPNDGSARYDVRSDMQGGWPNGGLTR